MPDEALRKGLEQACRLGTRVSDVVFTLVIIDRVRTDSKTPAWKARISFVGPRRQAREPRRIQIDITAFEEILLEPEYRPVIHPYSDAIETQVAFCRMEEILAEKLRTILQRGYPRDVYDVWYIIQNAQERFDAETVRNLFAQKCAFKAVSYTGVDQLLSVLETKNTAAHWSRILGMQIRGLPDFEEIRGDLETGLRRLLS